MGMFLEMLVDISGHVIKLCDRKAIDLVRHNSMIGLGLERETTRVKVRLARLIAT